MPQIVQIVLYIVLHHHKLHKSKMSQMSQLFTYKTKVLVSIHL